MTPRKYDTISFLSDYGTRDEFVGIVKGVISDLAPHTTVIDLTHEIAPFDVRAGSLALARCIAYVPSGIVLAVVDPGVGTSRRGVAVSVGGGRGVLIGPDNGLLSMGTALAGGADAAVVLNNPKYQLEAPGATFAGRDIFAPAAAHLCNGVPLNELGDAIDPTLLLPGIVPLSRMDDGRLVAEITWVDRYGNCQLNIGPQDLHAAFEAIDAFAKGPESMMTTVFELEIVTATGERVSRSAKVVANFASIGGGVGLVVDSFGMLALCLDRGSAAQELGIGVGDSVSIAPSTESNTGTDTNTAVTTNVQLRRGPSGTSATSLG